MDLIYTPRPTAFVRHAANYGCKAVDGISMLARQGALAFEAWTDVPANEVLGPMLTAASKA